jgi:hypothetical protein
MKPEEVFLVLQYSYDDTEVLAVFYDEDKAKAYEARMGKEWLWNWCVHHETISMIVEDA